LISLSFRLVSDQSLIGSGVASVRYLTGGGRPYTATAVQKMLRGVRSKIES
jgi:hypothetical protein